MPGTRLFSALLLTAVSLFFGAPLSAQVPASPAAEEVRTPRTPALSPDGSRVAFAWHGDLWIAPTAGGEAKRVALLPGYDTRPRWSPDGQTLAFVSSRNGNGDIYSIPVSGGSPTQVTFHSADDQLGDWSPDGKEIYFSSARESRSSLLYAIRLADGRLRRLTVDEIALHSPSVSPDGKWVAYDRGSANTGRKGYRGSQNAEIYLLPLTGDSRLPKRLTNYIGNDFWPLFGEGGRSLYYVSDHEGVFNLWQRPLTGAPTPRQVTRLRDGAIRNPTISQDRKTIVFEKDFGLWTLSLAGGGTPQRIALRAVDEQPRPQMTTRTFTGGATEYEVSPDGKRIAFVAGGEIFTVAADKGGDALRVTKCPARDGSLAWSPDSRTLAFVSDRDVNQDVYTVEIGPEGAVGQEKRLTTSIVPETAPEFSPDGRWIAYLRGPGGRAICVQPAAGGTERVAVEGPALTTFSWSPDSSWLAYTKRDLANTTDIWIAPVDGSARPLNVTRYPGTNGQPRWTADGKRLIFMSNRASNRGDGSEIFSLALTRAAAAATPALAAPPAAGTTPPAPPAQATPAARVAVEPRGLEKRVRQLTNQPQSTRFSFTLSPDGKTCYYTQTAAGQSDLYSVPAEGGAAKKEASGIRGAIRLTADGSTFYYQGGGGPPGGGGGRGGGGFGGLGGGSIYRVPRAGGTPAAVTFTAKLEVDPAEERRQAFDEGWRLLRDSFYDEKMHGVNWNAVRERYRPLVDDCIQREDFIALMAEMIGELNASHLGVSAGGAGGGRRPPGAPGGPTVERGGLGFLGIWFDYDHAGPGLKVTDVMPDSPAAEEETLIRPGEFILSIDGKDVTASESLFQVLANKAGQEVQLLVNAKPSKEGARTVKLKPIGRAQWSDLWYERWVAQNRKRVEELSGGRLAYMHIKAMDDASLKRFEKELLSEAYGKEGVVLDVRWNGGGRIHDELFALLTRRVHGYETPRGGLKMTQPFSAFQRPMILLINQNSASDAEIFPHGFKYLGLGRLVGVPTMGAVIGTSDQTLLDGATRFRVPRTGWTTPEGTNMENLGIAPDVYVENRPEDLIAGRDRQLDTAAQELLKQLSARK